MCTYVCIPLPLSSRSKNDERKRERDKSITRVKRRDEKITSSLHFFANTNTRRGNRLASVSSFFFLFFFFAKHKHKKVVENFVRLKIDMDVWI